MMQMNKQNALMLVSGACVSLAMLTVAVAQDEDSPDPVEPAVEAVELDTVELDAGDIGFEIVIQEGGINAEDEMLDQIMKELIQQGLSRQEVEEMFGRTREAEPAIDESNTVVTQAEDGSALYLPIGTTEVFTFEEGTTLELPFVADGPGLLTVAYGGGATQMRVELLDDRGRRLEWEPGRSPFNAARSPVQHRLIPIGEEGSYTIRIAGQGTGELTLGAEWLPFPQIEGGEVVILPSPEPETEVVLIADRMVTGEIDQSDAEQYYLWCRFDATEDGQLIVLASADQGDITMSSFNEGEYRRAIEHVDSDMNGSVANEGIVVDVVAGQAYYVRVEMLSGERCGVELRTGWVELPE